MAHYIALIHKEPDSCYGVLFPDFPGCISGGDSYDEAIISAVEALSFHVSGMKEDGDPIPDPRSLEQIRAAEDWITWEGAVATLVPLLPPPDVSERINITMPKRLLAQIDSVSRNRSGFLAEAARTELSRRRSA